jgi:hypothetical protein
MNKYNFQTQRRSRAAEAKERRAIFAANASASADTPTNNP